MNSVAALRNEVFFWLMMLALLPVFIVILPVKRGAWCKSLYSTLRKVS
jgi:hypothetical protein